MKTQHLRKKLKTSLIAGALMLSLGNAFGQAVTTLTFAYTGSIQAWTVPALCVNQVTIQAKGAQGGTGITGTAGKGASMKGTFALSAGQIVSILVGQCPGPVGNYSFPGGGGGSFVGLGPYATASPMLVAGGGGGANDGATGDSAPITTSGTGGSPGTNGNGAPSSACGGGGGGFFTSGGNDLNYSFNGGKGFQQGGAGGLPTNGYLTTYQPGGFGGGAPANYIGSCNLRAGAGGGYSGGSAYGTSYYSIGSAGGSYNGGTNQTNAAGTQTGSGVVYVSFISGIEVNVTASNTLICAGQSANLTASSPAALTNFTWSNGQTTPVANVSPQLTSTVTVMGLDPVSGCTGTSSIKISVLESPNISVLALKQSVCEGESVTMYATSAVSYTWSEGPSFGSAITVTPTIANNTYTVIGSGPNGCTSYVTQQITVNQLPLVTVSGNTMICQGAPANLTASGANSYQWKASNLFLQANPITIYPLTTTAYSVVGTSAAGCKGTTLLVVAVDPCTGIQTINGNAAGVSVYPNPNAGIFAVSLANGLNKTIEVVDITGRVILSNTTTNDVTDVNISTLANGVYYVKIRSENVSDVVKVIKQ